MPVNYPKQHNIGRVLRHAREEMGLNGLQLSRLLAVDPATLSRWETGKRAPKPKDVARYLSACRASPELIAEIMEDSHDPSAPHWLAIGMPEQHRQLSTLVDLESKATAVHASSPLLVLGLFQTGAYATAIMRAADVPADELATRVAVRVGRREAVTRKRAPVKVEAFIGEAAIRQRIGGGEVMQEQLQFLVEMAERGNVDLRILPLAIDWHPALEGIFTFIEFPEGDPVVHVENRLSGLFLHQADEVAAYRDALDKIRKVALAATASIDLIRTIGIEGGES